MYDSSLGPESYVPPHRGRCTLCGLVFGVIALLLVTVGLVRLPDNHTASAVMTVVNAACAPNDDPYARFHCSVTVRFAIAGRQYGAAGVDVYSAGSLAPGANISLLYDPHNPSDIVQRPPLRVGSVCSISIGAVIGAVNLTLLLRRLLQRSAGLVDHVIK